MENLKQQLADITNNPYEVAAPIRRIGNREKTYLAKKPLSNIRFLPSIKIRNRDIFCNGLLIPTSKKNLTLELFKIFIERKKSALSREELMNTIYCGEGDFKHSLRYYESCSHNMVKLISRARVLANDYTNLGDYKWIDWFCYCPNREAWTFYNLTHEYIRDKERQLRTLLSS